MGGKSSFTEEQIIRALQEVPAGLLPRSDSPAPTTAVVSAPTLATGTLRARISNPSPGTMTLPLEMTVTP